jgi:Fe-S-cluster containining protein
MFNPCSGCLAPCCTNYIITVTSFDVLRISEKTGMKPDQFSEFYPAKLLNQDWRAVLFFFDRGELPDQAILALKSWPCVFLEENRCKIHEISPFACKRYPHDLEGNLRRRDCSIISQAFFVLKGPQVEKMKEEIDRYHLIVKEWNESKGKKKDCMDFLIKRSADFKGYPD